ncbi:MAG: ABC transporter permease [Candidatus Dadabacteria bacterium]|nr:MAG: ABC transporter permease [Candidatus Dadabacteria bacterium]
MIAVTVRSIERLGYNIIEAIASWGRSWIFLFKTLRAVLSLPISIGLVFRQVLEIGFNSLLVISLIGAFTGAVLAVQGEYTLSKFGADAWTGPMIALSLIRELAPVLTALMVIGRSGSAITAEIGIMKITEQIDALRSMAIDPIKYLMAPRLIAGVICMPLLMAVFTLVGIGGGYFVGTVLLNLNPGAFIQQIRAAVDMVDINSGLIKSTVFGFIFSWVSCYKGYTCGFGAVGVNKATTQSVVIASVSVLVVDYFLTSILTKLFY